MVQVPVPTIETTPSELTVQTLGVLLLQVTGKPEVAVPVNWKDGSVYFADAGIPDISTV